MDERALSLVPLSILLGLTTPKDSHAGEIPVLGWSEVEALVDGHPAMSKSVAKIELSKAELSEAKQYPNPELEAGAGYGDPSGASNGSFVWNLELTVPIEWIAERKYLAKKAEKGIEAAGWEREALRLEVLGELRLIFVTIAYDREVIEALEKSEKNLGELVEAIALKVEVSDLRQVELARVQIELEKAKIATKKARAQASTRKAQLDLWLGGALPDDFDVDFDLELPATIPELEELLAAASEDHPLVLAGAMKVLAAEAGIQAEKHAAFPEMSIGLFAGQEPDVTSYGGIFSMSLPLWNWNKAGTDKAKALKLETESDQALLLIVLRSRILAAHAEATLQVETAGKYEDVILPAAQGAFDDLLTAYEEGDAELIDLIDARRTLVEAQIEHLSVLLDLQLALSDLTTLTGGDKP